MKVDFLIVGGGITGLALGWYLKKRHGTTKSIKILEGADRAGGWIRTSHTKGYLFEQGPRSCRTKGTGVDTLQLIEELGLCDQVIAASKAAQRRYLYVDGRLQELPRSLSSFLSSPLMKGVIPALWNDFWLPRGDGSDETIAEFIGRRLSPEVAERLVDPLVSGIYAGDIHQLSMNSCFPEIYQYEKECGSLIRGMFRTKDTNAKVKSPFVHAWLKEPIFSLKAGMGLLVERLQHHLNEELLLSTTVEGLSISENRVNVRCRGGTAWNADIVFLAVPARPAKNILFAGHASSRYPVEDATVAVVNMGWRNDVLKHQGFGYLIPSREKEKLLGVVFDSSAFPEQNTKMSKTRLTVMLGGSRHREIADMASDQIEELALEGVQRHLGIYGQPDAMQTTVAREAIPQYILGHQAMVKELKDEVSRKFLGRVVLCGSAWHGVAVNDCIANAKRASQAS